MKWTAAERAMLAEMGVVLPSSLIEPADAAAPVPLAAVPVAPASVRAPAVDSGIHAHEPPLRPSAERVRPAETVVAPPVVQPVAGGDWAKALDWPSLQVAVSDCRRCGLCETRRHTVFGVGNPQAHWMIVGEAPGEQEDRSGEPFVGPAGQLLDRMLQAVGLSRGGGPAGDPAREVFITNTVKCRPPQNRNPQAEELAACASVLHRQLTLVRPRLVLALGRFAAQQLLGTDEPIGRLRGRVHAWSPPADERAADRDSGAMTQGAEESASIPLVVSYHPAYLLRNPIDKAKAWADWCMALNLSSNPSPGAPSR